MSKCIRCGDEAKEGFSFCRVCNGDENYLYTCVQCRKQFTLGEPMPAIIGPARCDECRDKFGIISNAAAIRAFGGMSFNPNKTSQGVSIVCYSCGHNFDTEDYTDPYQLCPDCRFRDEWDDSHKGEKEDEELATHRKGTIEVWRNPSSAGPLPSFINLAQRKFEKEIPEGMQKGQRTTFTVPTDLLSLSGVPQELVDQIDEIVVEYER